jgi:hypothetical protein
MTVTLPIPKTIDDQIYAERAAGIRNGYWVFTGIDEKTYVIFDTGELQDEDGVVVSGNAPDLLNQVIQLQQQQKRTESVVTQDDEETRLNDWCQEAGSAVEMWGDEELRAKILNILDMGGDVKPLIVDAPVSGFQRSLGRGQDDEIDMVQLRGQLGTAITGDDDENFPTDPAMLKAALQKANRYLSQGYEVIGYCDNIDQAEIIVAKQATDSMGSSDPNDVLISLWQKAKTATGPEKEMLTAQVQRLQAKIAKKKVESVLNQQATVLVQEVVGRARMGAWCPNCKKKYPSHYAYEHCPVCRSKLTRHEPHETTPPSKPTQTEFPDGSK